MPIFVHLTSNVPLLLLKMSIFWKQNRVVMNRPIKVSEILSIDTMKLMIFFIFVLISRQILIIFYYTAVSELRQYFQ